jgi:hypothetical protein
LEALKQDNLSSNVSIEKKSNNSNLRSGGGFKKFNPNELDSDRSIGFRKVTISSMGKGSQPNSNKGSKRSLNSSKNGSSHNISSFKRHAKRMKSVKMFDADEDDLFDGL